jgi:phosphoserine phosphatase
MHEIEEEIESLEWKIQTTPLAFKEEKALINQIRPLEAQLLGYKQMQKLKDDIFTLQKESGALEAEAKLHHEKLSELAEQSQAFHEKRIKALDQIRTIKVEADVAHQKYVWMKEQVQEISQKYVELSRQIESLEQKLRQAEGEKKAERQTELLKDLEDRAREKLKRGEKLTLEEFKILAEKGIL